MDRKEGETRLKAIQDELEKKANEYREKYYSLILDEARNEAEQARREAEIERQKALKLCEETRRSTARIRTAANREVPDGTIRGIVKTEWATFLNIAQTPS